MFSFFRKKVRFQNQFITSHEIAHLSKIDLKKITNIHNF